MRVKVRNTKTGEVLNLFSVDARECVAGGEYETVGESAETLAPPAQPPLKAEAPEVGDEDATPKPGAKRGK